MLSGWKILSVDPVAEYGFRHLWCASCYSGRLAKRRCLLARFDCLWLTGPRSFLCSGGCTSGRVLARVRSHVSLVLWRHTGRYNARDFFEDWISGSQCLCYIRIRVV